MNSSRYVSMFHGNKSSMFHGNNSSMFHGNKHHFNESEIDENKLIGKLKHHRWVNVDLFSHRKYYSVTWFGSILPLWPFLVSVYLVFGKISCHWANFHFLNCQIFKNNLAVWFRLSLILNVHMTCSSHPECFILA